MSATFAVERPLPDHPRLVRATTRLEPLAHRLSDPRAACRGEELSVRRIFKIGRDLAEALTCLHLRDQAAGQVDAANIWVDADFGEARLEPKLSADGASATRHAQADAERADLHQLGVLLFELCCRRALRPREDLAHFRHGFALVCLINPAVPPEGDRVIGRLLGGVPGGRYARAKQVFDDLRAVLAGIDAATTPARSTGPVAAGASVEAVAPVAHAARLPRASPTRRFRHVAVVLTVVLAGLKLASPTPREPRDVRRARATRNVAAHAPDRPVRR